MIWLLIIINIAGGEPALVPMPSEEVCFAASDKVRLALGGILPLATATCIYTGDPE